MTKYGNIVAAAILGGSLIIAAVIVNTGLHNASDTIRKGMAFPAPPSLSFPGTITVVNGNSPFGVELRTPDFNRQPIKVEVQAEKR